MGNNICCHSRNKNDELSDKEVEEIIKKKIKKESNDELKLRIQSIKSERRGDIIFCILMGASATITITIIVCGVPEPNLASSLVVSIGATGYYFNEILEKNKLIDIYRQELKDRENKIL